jgi:hypothetical protein
MVAALPVSRTMARRPRSIAAPVARRARQRPAPTRWDDPSSIGDRGISVMRDPPSCRGQALPDPPARQGRPSPRVVRMTTVRGALPPPRRVTARCRAGAQRARQRVAPTRKGAAPRGPVVAPLGSRRPPPGRGRRCRTPERRVALPQRPAAQDTRQGTGCPLALGPRLLERGDEWPDRPLVATLPGQRLDEQRFDSGG